MASASLLNLYFFFLIALSVSELHKCNGVRHHDAPDEQTANRTSSTRMLLSKNRFDPLRLADIRLRSSAYSNSGTITPTSIGAFDAQCQQWQVSAPKICSPSAYSSIYTVQKVLALADNLASPS